MAHSSETPPSQETKAETFGIPEHDNFIRDSLNNIAEKLEDLGLETAAAVGLVLATVGTVDFITGGKGSEFLQNVGVDSNIPEFIKWTAEQISMIPPTARAALGGALLSISGATMLWKAESQGTNE